MVDDEDKKIYYPMSFLEQMAWVQEDYHSARSSVYHHRLY